MKNTEQQTVVLCWRYIWEYKAHRLYGQKKKKKTRTGRRTTKQAGRRAAATSYSNDHRYQKQTPPRKHARTPLARTALRNQRKNLQPFPFCFKLILAPVHHRDVLLLQVVWLPAEHHDLKHRGGRLTGDEDRTKVSVPWLVFGSWTQRSLAS